MLLKSLSANSLLSLCLLFLSCASPSSLHDEKSVHCTYDTWEWNTRTNQSVNLRKVSKLRSELTPEEIGSIPGCSVCREDQIELQISDQKFQVCKIYSARIQSALERAIQHGFKIQSIVGYRVGKSKGPIDSNGLRTEFSNHSYGTAIDLNSETHGLYDSCVQFGPGCRLIRGGRYNPNDPSSITRTSAVYQSMLAVGLKWGGEIQAKQN